MPYNLLLLPLLGGFIFARYWNVSRYHVLRAEKERLLIIAALAGLGWLIVAFTIVKLAGALFPCSPDFPCLHDWWVRNVPFEYSGTSLLAFALGATCWRPLNLRHKRTDAIDSVIEEDNSPLELLLKKAQDEGKTVAVTLKNSKVYIGFVIHTFNPALPTKYIQLLPTKSGYRDDKNRWFRFTTFYSKALDKIESDYSAKLDQWDNAQLQLEEAKHEFEKEKSPEIKRKIKHLTDAVIPALDKELKQLSSVVDDLNIVLAVSEIISINIYSEYIHAQYFPPEANDSSTL